MLSTIKFRKKSSKSPIKDINSNEEYKQNQMQINCIKKTLIEHADVPEKLINWLIDSVKENTILELKNK